MIDSTATPMEPIARALLVCDDPEAIEAFTGCMQQLAVAAEVCLDASKAADVLNRRKIEAIVVDVRRGPASREVVQSVRVSPSNKKIVLMAIVDGEDTRKLAVEVGASFIFEPPFSQPTIEPTLRVAYGMIVRERRRYYRAVLDCPVYVKALLQPEFCCTSINISEGGISIMTDTPVVVGEELEIRLTLPESAIEVHSTVNVRWRDASGRAGLQFISLFRQPEVLAALQEWLGSRLEASFPKSISLKFKKRGLMP